jgi:hypothetical protein
MELPLEYKDKINEWLDDYEIVYFWKKDETYLVTCSSDGVLYFMRLFKIGGHGSVMPEQIVLSQDKVYDIERKISL